MNNYYLNNLKKNNLDLLILDKKSSEQDYNNFIIQYDKNNKDLCLKKNGIKTQNIYQFIDRNYNFFKNFNYMIYYILKNNKIMAFCLIEDDTKHKIINVILLCSSNEKIKINNISLGKYLLNIIYNTFVKKEYLILIQPATDELIPYYKKWKNPSFDKLDETYGQLIYGNLKSKSNETLSYIFSSLVNINMLKKYLNLNINTNKINNLDELKEIFRTKLHINNKLYSNSEKDQLSRKIDNLTYISPKQIKTML